jgi:hypothetical protein
MLSIHPHLCCSLSVHVPSADPTTPLSVNSHCPLALQAPDLSCGTEWVMLLTFRTPVKVIAQVMPALTPHPLAP